MVDMFGYYLSLMKMHGKPIKVWDVCRWINNFLLPRISDRYAKGVICENREPVDLIFDTSWIS